MCGSEAGEGGGDGGRRVQYYIKVMRLFEQVPSPNYVVKVTRIATKLVNREHPNAVSLLTTSIRVSVWKSGLENM